MDSRIGMAILSLITIGALSFAAFTYFNRPGTTPPVAVVASPTPKPTLSAIETTDPSASPTASASATPAPTRSFSPSQALSMPSEVETLELGSSVFAIATKHSISMESLAKLNGISDINSVQAGKTLIIPDDVNGDSYTILFVLNKNRQSREEQKVKDGGSSLYTDPITAAQTDTKGIYGLGADTPFSKSNETDTAMTLSTSDENRIITISIEKLPTGLWASKKMVIKITKKDSE